MTALMLEAHGVIYSVQYASNVLNVQAAVDDSDVHDDFDISDSMKDLMAVDVRAITDVLGIRKLMIEPPHVVEYTFRQAFTNLRVILA
jgi:hypothetical protein